MQSPTLPLRLTNSRVLAAKLALVVGANLAGSFAHAEVLDFSAVDFGVAGFPSEGAPLPGADGTIFLTVKNSGPDPLSDVVLDAYPGDCVDAVSGAFSFGDVPAGQTKRSETGVAIRMSASCQRGSKAGLLALGTFRAAGGERRRVWAEGVFLVAPFPIARFTQDNIGLALPDMQTTAFSFRIVEGFPIRDVSISLRMTHSSPRDLLISLRHPSGKLIELGRTADLNPKFGAGGVAVPALAQLAGLPSKGDWALIFKDDQRSDSGILQRVDVTIRPQ